MKRIYLTLLSYALFLLLLLWALVNTAGKQTVLEHAAEAKPYAVVFQSEEAAKSREPVSGPLIIFMGDSSVDLPPWSREGTASIPSLLETNLRETLPNADDVRIMDWSFLAARPFHYFCLLFEAERFSPDLLIIPVNWRVFGSFSERWRKMSKFHELSSMIPFNERFSASGREILKLEGISVGEEIVELCKWSAPYMTGTRIYAQTRLGIRSLDDPALAQARTIIPEPVPETEDEDIEDWTIGNFSDERLFDFYKLDLPVDNAELQTIGLMAEAAERRGIRVLFYLTPIHIEEMRGRDTFNSLVFQKSVDRVMDSVTSSNVTCLNIIDLLDEKDFIDSFEHYSPDGTVAIAHSLTPRVLERIGQSPEK